MFPFRFPKILIIVLLFGFACTNEAPKQGVSEKKTDTVLPVVTQVIDSSNIAPAYKKEPELEISEKTLMDNHWTNVNVGLIKDFNFKENSKLIVNSTTDENEQSKETLSWALHKDTLFVYGKTDTSSYQIKSITATAITLKIIDDHNKNFFDTNSKRDDGAFYNFIYQDDEYEAPYAGYLVGVWGNGDDYQFKGDHQFIYHDPPCGDDVTGDWQITKNKLQLHFISTPCSTKNYDSNYTILRLTGHWLILKDSKGKIRILFRN